VYVKVILHPEMDTPACKQSFERKITVTEDIIHISAYCMQFVKNSTKGISKNENAGEGRQYDLDRKRDDESIIDV